MWDIKFNPAKSQVITFGGRQPQSITITMDDAAIPWANRVKYIGCYFLSPSNGVDV